MDGEGAAEGVRSAPAAAALPSHLDEVEELAVMRLGERTTQELEVHDASEVEEGARDRGYREAALDHAGDGAGGGGTRRPGSARDGAR